MDKKAFYSSLTAYKASMKQAKTMLDRGFISPKDYAKIDTIIAKKYGLNSCSIYAQNPLINP